MRFVLCVFILVPAFLSVVAARSDADGVDDLLQKARSALENGQADAALELAGKAIALNPKDARAYLLRGVIYEIRERHEQAVADFDAVLRLDPQSAEAYNRRGSEQFKLGRIADSIADFDKFLELRPDQKPGHWKRGISYYYAGRFDEGRQQFEGYEKVDTNDVENAVWHYLCNARVVGAARAREALLKIGKDRRVPMMQVYELFGGKIKPEDVLKAVREGAPTAEQLQHRLFYAHLYLGLYYESEGNKKEALTHLAKAAEHKINHYMWDVARVHRDLLQKKEKK